MTCPTCDYLIQEYYAGVKAGGLASSAMLALDPLRDFDEYSRLVEDERAAHATVQRARAGLRQHERTCREYRALISSRERGRSYDADPREFETPPLLAGMGEG